MELNCKYHPKEPAAWSCPNCEVHFCNSCVPEDNTNYFPKCTLCRRSLRSLSVANRVPQFWEVFGEILSRPFNLGILLFVLLFAAVFSVLSINTKLGLVLSILATLPVIEFLFEIMERTASGNSLKRGPLDYLNFQVKSQSIKLLFGAGILVAILVKIYAGYPSLGILLTAFFALGIPASLMILMMEKSILAMFNPLKIGFLIKLMGSAYFLLYGLMLLVAFLGVKVSGASDNISFLGQVIFYFSILYLSISIAVIAGYLVYQFHHELNFSIDRSSLHQIDNQSKRRFKAVQTDSIADMAEIDIFIQEGRFEDAQKSLLAKVNANPNDYRANEKLILLYAIQDKTDWMNKLAAQYFEHMINRGKSKQAADFIERLFERGIDYYPDSGFVVYGLAKQMQNKKQFQLALTLIEQLLKLNNRPKNWELIYLLQAKILVEFANRVGDAKSILQDIINRSVDQAIMQEAEDYLRLIS